MHIMTLLGGQGLWLPSLLHVVPVGVDAAPSAALVVTKITPLTCNLEFSQFGASASPLLKRTENIDVTVFKRSQKSSIVIVSHFCLEGLTTFPDFYPGVL